MRRWLLAIACVLAAFSALAGGVGREPVRVLLVGDSITAGKVSEPLGPPYAEHLRELLGNGYAVSSRGIKGSSAVDWVEPRLLEKIESKMPVEIASILLGTNDSVGFRRPRSTLPAEYGEAIRRLVEVLLGLGAERVILMTPPPSHRAARSERLLGYREQILAICSSRERTVCGPDLYQLLDVETDYEQGQIHPNAHGHRKIAEALARTILSIPPASSAPGPIGRP